MVSAAYVDVSFNYQEFYDHTMLPDRSIEDVETAWMRAQGFIQQYIILPLKQDGWELEVDGGALKRDAYAHASGLEILSWAISDL